MRGKGEGPRSWIKHMPGKRVMDICIAVPAMVLTAPLMLITAIAVRLRLGTPVLFKQARIGFGGHPFTLLKFRTMTNDRDQTGALLSDEDRLTKFGRFVRSTSLDELPEIWHVVRGEMSVVGPRPLLPEYVPLYTEEQGRRHNTPPGMAGPVMAMGRNSLPWERKFELDAWYADNRSLGLDIKLLVLSIVKLVTRQGVSQEGRATMERFEGLAPDNPGDNR